MNKAIGAEINGFPRGSGKITLIPKNRRGVLKDNIPHATMVKCILEVEAQKTGNRLVYEAIGEDAIIFFEFYEACDYPQAMVEKKEEAEYVEC